MASMPHPLTKFHLFPNLPPELRLKIWHLALLPRLIPLKTLTSSPPLSANQHIYITTPLPPPALLSTTHESRLVALSHYTLAFGTKPDPSSKIVASEPRVYFNFEEDVAWLEAGNGGKRAPDRMAMLVAEEERARIRNLAVEEGWRALRPGDYVGVRTLAVVFGETGRRLGGGGGWNGSFGGKEGVQGKRWSVREWRYEDAVSEEWLRTPVAYQEYRWPEGRPGLPCPKIRILEIVWKD